MAEAGLEGAIRLAQEGKTRDAHELLERLVNSDVHNVTAWFWYARTAASGRERTRILETCLRFNPDDPNTRTILGLAPSLPAQPQATEAPAAPNSLSFNAAGSAVREDDSAATTQPIKSFKPAHPRTAPPPAPDKRRVSAWLILGSVLLLGVLCLAAGWFAYNAIPPDPASHRHAGAAEYFLYVPRTYTRERDWPLFVGIHGSGGTGLDCWDWWQPYADREGFVLLCPSIADAGGGWDQADGEAKVLDAVNRVRGEYQLGSRIFLAGFSAGGQFAQGLAFRSPQHISGLAVLSAGNYYEPASAATFPVIVVIGDRDDPLALSASADFAYRLRQAGSDVEYVVLPGVAHALTPRAQQLTIELFRKTLVE